MAVRLPLNHFVTDLHSADKRSIEVLEDNIANLKLKSTAFQILEKISYIALLAIVGTVFAVSYNLLVLTGAAPLVMAGMILISPLLIMAPIKFAQLARQYSSLAETESRTALHMRQIENWNSDQVDQFFRQNEIDIQRVNLDALRQIHVQEPKKALLPLIARYNSMVGRVEEVKRAYTDAPAKLEEHFRRREEEGHPTDEAVKQKIRYENQCAHWNNLEIEAIPTAINAATLLYLIENPTTADMDVLPSSFTVPNVGICAPRNYPERIFGKTNLPENDDYFIFDPRLNRAPLKHEDLNRLHSRQIKQILFPNRVAQ